MLFNGRAVRRFAGEIRPVVSHETPRTMAERMEGLEEKVARTEAKRQEFLPDEMRIRLLENKFGRAGHFPAYAEQAVSVPYEDRIPHLADRLGKYGDQSGMTMMHEWLQIETDQENPAYGSPFVQRPIEQPDADLNFEKGEMIYHNPNVLKNSKLAHRVYLALFADTVGNLLHTLFSGRAIWPCGDEMMDLRSDGLSSLSESWLFSQAYSYVHNWHDFSPLALNLFLAPLLPACIYAFLKFPRVLLEDVVISMQYNKDRDLVFVTKGCSRAFSSKTEEHVYEFTHLQILPPSVGMAAEFSSHVTCITDMYAQDNLHVFEGSDYWTQEEAAFKQKLYNMWQCRLV